MSSDYDTRIQSRLFRHVGRAITELFSRFNPVTALKLRLAANLFF
jgi:hypothetical protein